MFLLMLGVAVSLAVVQAPPPNPACSLLTSSQVTSLIGAAKATPMSSTPMGSSCMLQAGDKILTVLIVNASSPEGATRQFDSKKKIVSGEAVPGWTLPAYAGSQRPAAAVVGFLKGQTFIEVKVVDSAQALEALRVKLTDVMKEIAGRK